jgi:ferritin
MRHPPLPVGEREAAMIGAKMQEALNRHVQAEVSSSYIYLAMSAWCEAKAWKGFARWLRVQSEEELGHAKKSLDFLLARGGEAKLASIEAPPSSWASVHAVFDAVLEHERRITAFVNDLSAVAEQEKDRAAAIFLQWFVAEQVEEEARVAEIVDRLRMVSDRPGAALYLDKEYGKRGKAAP